MATDTFGSVTLRTDHKQTRATIVPSVGGWSRIVSVGKEPSDRVDLHTLLEDLLAQQIAKDRRFSALVGVDPD